MYPNYLSSDTSWFLGHPLLEKSTLIMHTISDIAFSRSHINIAKKSGHNNSVCVPQCVSFTVTEYKFNSCRGSRKHKGLLHSPRKLIRLYFYGINILFQRQSFLSP